MEDLQKSVFINELFDIYGELLSKTQQKMIHLYYNLDLSLSEISTQEGISRNAVYDALKKGIESLNLLENKLHILDNNREFKEKLVKLESCLSKEDYQKVISIFKEEK